MHSIIYISLVALLSPFANGCLSSHEAQHLTDTTHIDTQLKLLAARQQPPLSTLRTALTNVRIFNGRTIGNPTTVVIDGSSLTFNTRGIQHTIDGKGGVLLPGLIDSHIHLSTLASLKTLSSYGITAVMNMGCANYTLCAAMRAQTGLTSFYTAGDGAVAPNSTHAKAFYARGYVNSSAQASEFVANVFANGSEYMKVRYPHLHQPRRQV